MSADSDRLDDLAGSVSDGDTIDWAGVGEHAAESAGFAALHDVARIADFNRRLQRPPGEGPGEGGAPGRPAEPRRWGDLLLLEPVGSGASGDVWRAWDLKLEREVALKFLQPREGPGSGGRDEALLAEGRALARVRHPGVVAVHGMDAHDGRPGLWMELLRGETLAAAIERRGALPPAEVARLGRELARALEAVHAAGLVHADVKPANVVLEPDGRVVLTDFGLGRLARTPERGMRLSGTPVFMAPERLAGGPATAASDLYALGVTLWWALAGRCPFAARTLADLLEESRRGPGVARAPGWATAPRGLTAAIDRAMAADPGRRFASAAALAGALDGVPAPPRADAERRGARARGGRAAAAVAAVIVVAAAGWLLAGRGPRPAGDAAPAAGAPGAAGPAAPEAYDVEATLVRHGEGAPQTLAEGDRVRPGDRLSLRFQATRDAWVYVLNEDERGESYLLFPQPLFDRANPVPRGTAVMLPGPVRGRENAWTVSSRGHREHFLVVASPHPLPALEAELARLPAAARGRTIRYATVPAPAIEELRGVGGVEPLPAGPLAEPTHVLERFAALAGRETAVRGVWVRRLTLENPLR